MIERPIKSILAIALLATTTLSGCDSLPGRPNPADVPLRPSAIADFSQLYSENCAGCHGADGKGNGPFPRLAGQLHDYTFNKLVNWSKERGQDPAKPDTSAIMEPIAHGLGQQQVKAVAAYLNYLE